MAQITELSKKINNICRICLKQGDEMSPIFEDNINTSTLTVLADKITSIAPVEMSPTDGLPTSICKICRKQVDQFHEFRLLVEISDRTLRSCIKNEEIEIKDETSDAEKSDSENQCEELPMVISETQDKDPANYALLVSTSSGLQLWKISDLEQNQLLDKVRNDSTVPTKKIQVKIPTDSNPKITISKPSDESIRFRQYSDTNNDRIVKNEKNNSDEFLKADTNCELCSKTFGSLEELKNHISEHCFENESEDSPDPLFFQKSPMDFCEPEEHDDEFGNGSIEFFIQEDDENSSKKITDGCYEKKGLKVKRKVGQILFKCNKCEKVFPKTYLKKHLEKCRRREPSPLDCNECGKQFLKKSELRYHKGTHLSSPLSCTECENKTFRNIQSYKMHMKRHTLGSRYNCNTCEKSYYTNSELARHVQQHLGRRKFPCHLCDTSFLSKPELNRHLKYHNGVKRFECHLCYKSYYESGHLKVHLRVHTGERPFVCPTCNKGFVTRSKLVRHSKTHK